MRFQSVRWSHVVRVVSTLALVPTSAHRRGRAVNQVPTASFLKWSNHSGGDTRTNRRSRQCLDCCLEHRYLVFNNDFASHSCGVVSSFVQSSVILSRLPSSQWASRASLPCRAISSRHPSSLAPIGRCGVASRLRFRTFGFNVRVTWISRHHHMLR